MVKEDNTVRMKAVPTKNILSNFEIRSDEK
jgi:hypothetical protein